MLGMIIGWFIGGIIGGLFLGFTGEEKDSKKFGFGVTMYSSIGLIWFSIMSLLS